MVFNSDELDFAQPYDQPQVNNNTELMAYFEKRYNDGLSALVPENEAVLDKLWTLRNGDKIYGTNPKIEIIRMAFSQQIHHRAQLGVYLRLLNYRYQAVTAPVLMKAILNNIIPYKIRENKFVTPTFE